MRGNQRLLLTWLIAATIAISTLFMSSATATILVNEQFTHMDGDLMGNTPTPGPGGTWETHSGTSNQIQVVNGEAVVNAQTGFDDNTGFATRDVTATTYARFDFRLPASTNSDIVNLGSDGYYFAHFRGGTGTSFRARVGVLAPDVAEGGGDYKLVISAQSNLSNGTTWGSQLDFDTTYRVVTEYNAATQQSRLWLDPTDESSTNITAANSLSASDIFSYALRQNGDYDGQVIVDNLVVATSFDEALTGVPEPGAILLLLTAVTGMGLFRRR